jgi:tetratricopeptide (TPR) repeat protein
MKNRLSITGLLLLALILTGNCSKISGAEKCQIPLKPVFPEDQALSAYEQGYRHYRHGRFTQSEEKLLEAVSIEPNLIKAHYWLGKLYRETGHLESAIFHWQEVKRLSKLIKDRRIALSVQNNEYPAHSQILRIVEERKKAGQHFEKGIYLLDKGHWDGAEVEIREAVRLYPANHKFLRTLARVLWDKNEKSASIKFYRDLLVLKDVSFEDFREGINRMFQANMKFIAAPIVIEKREKFSDFPEFNKICAAFERKTDNDIVSAATVLERHDGQVIINIGLNQGLELKDEFSLNLRAFKPGKPITDPTNGKTVGRTLDQPTADLMITKINRQSSWALIQREMGSGVKAGDKIEIKKAIR